MLYIVGAIVVALIVWVALGFVDDKEAQRQSLREQAERHVLWSSENENGEGEENVMA